jgi:hypothetical protein
MGVLGETHTYVSCGRAEELGNERGQEQCCAALCCPAVVKCTVSVG